MNILLKIVFKKFEPISMPTKMCLNIPASSHICQSLLKLDIINVFYFYQHGEL